jgi:hypothetical protein
MTFMPLSARYFLNRMSMACITFFSEFALSVMGCRAGAMKASLSEH